MLLFNIELVKKRYNFLKKKELFDIKKYECLFFNDKEFFKEFGISKFFLMKED